MAPNKREEIMQAALMLFAERGYDGTTVPMIADKAKVGAGTIYRYFDNKEALVNALFQYCVKQFSGELTPKLMNDEKNIRDQFRDVFTTMMNYAEEHMDALLFIESHSGAYYLDEESHLIYNDMLDSVRRIVEKGKQEGIIKNVYTDALICIVYGALIQFSKMMNKQKLSKDDAIFNGVEECCWHSIRV